MFYQGKHTLPASVYYAGLISSFAFSDSCMPRLTCPQPSRIPEDFDNDLEEDQRVRLYVQPFMQAFIQGASLQRVFHTTDRRIGVVGREVRVGDRVALLAGAKVPFLVRRRQVGNR